MKAHKGRNVFAIRLALVGAALFCCLGFVIVPSGSSSSAPAKPNRYIGAAKCKNCHASEESGDQFAAWESAGHSKAFEVLGSDEAKAIAEKLGIADAQKADECLKCHTTTFGEAEEMIKKGFKPKLGVQCESCHGPGEQHMKARFMAATDDEDEDGSGDEDVPAYTPPPEGEIIANPPMETCLGCHNKENPTFEKFCFYESIEKVRHLNPLKPRSEEDLAAMLVCGCGDECACVEECPDDGCGVAPPAKEEK